MRDKLPSGCRQRAVRTKSDDFAESGLGLREPGMLEERLSGSQSLLRGQYLVYDEAELEDSPRNWIKSRQVLQPTFALHVLVNEKKPQSISRPFLLSQPRTLRDVL